MEISQGEKEDDLDSETNDTRWRNPPPPNQQLILGIPQRVFDLEVNDHLPKTRFSPCEESPRMFRGMLLQDSRPIKHEHISLMYTTSQISQMGFSRVTLVQCKLFDFGQICRCMSCSCKPPCWIFHFWLLHLHSSLFLGFACNFYNR